MSNTMKMVKVNSRNIPKASPCKVFKLDGSIDTIQPMESKYDYGNYTKIGGKSSQNATYLKEKEGE